MRYSEVFPRFLNALAGNSGGRPVLFSVFVGGLMVAGLMMARGGDLRSARCPAGIVTVIAASPADRATACAGASRATAVLDGLGLPVLDPIVVHVVDEISVPHGASALGIYDPKSRLVKVLARSAYSVGSADEAILGLPFDDDLHASVFAHEVTHAVFHQHQDRIPLSPAAHEYVAYSVQITTLPADHRRRILDRFEVTPFTDLEQVSGIILAFDPNGFGIRSYLHFRDAADQHAVLRGLAHASRSGGLEWY